MAILLPMSKMVADKSFTGTNPGEMAVRAQGENTTT
jgi:hypothetical protein